MDNNALVLNNETLEKVSKSTDGKYSAGVVATMIKTSFPSLTSIEQVVVAFQTANEYDLDPKMKEMYAWCDNKGDMTCIASASGFMKIARKQKGFISVESHAVYAGEKFEIDTGTGEVSHKIDITCRSKSDAKPAGAYCILRQEGKKPQVKYVNWADYYVKKNWSNPWDKQKDAMIEKCATTVLLRQAYGLSGLYGHEEMESTISSTTNVDNGVDTDAVDATVAEMEAQVINNSQIEQEEVDSHLEKEGEILDNNSL